MRVIDFQEFHDNLEQLVDELSPGESFIVSRDGVLSVMVTGLGGKDRSTHSGAEDAPESVQHDSD
jgi:hypothetical protein